MQRIDPNDPSLDFGKQFFLAPELDEDDLQALSKATFKDWRKLKGIPGHRLFTHPALKVAVSDNANTSVVLLGDAIDARQSSLDEAEIAKNVAECVRGGWDQVENALEYLAGRWILIVRHADQTRIYPDATGLKPIFYGEDSTNRLWLASQPALLEELGVTKRDHDLAAEFERYYHFGSWPVSLMPYSGVQQLVPNHYYDLVNQQKVRFWPLEEISPIPVHEAAEEMVGLLQSTLIGLVGRNPCIMGLTGGYDSRLLLACAKPVVEEITFFTSVGTDTPYYDIAIPKSLAKYWKLRHETPRGCGDKEFADKLARNVGGMSYESSLNRLRSGAEYADGRTILPAIVSEICRNFFEPSVQANKEPTSAELARALGFEGNPLAIDALGDWFQTLPRLQSINRMDLCYWEHRMGVWASCAYTCREAVLDAFPPMNLRKFLTLGIATPEESRVSPYKLIREMISSVDPGLLKPPFNYDFRDQVLKLPSIKRRLYRLLGRK